MSALRSADDVVLDAEQSTRELISQFQEMLRLARVGEQPHDAETLQIQHLTEAMAQSARLLEDVLSQLKYAALRRDSAETSRQVEATAAEYDAMSAAHASELERIASEVAATIRELEEHLLSAPHASLEAAHEVRADGAA